MKRSGSSMAARFAPALLLLVSNASAQSDGTLDPTFGFGGLTTVFFDLGGTKQDTATDVAIQPDGRIVVVGYADFDGLGDTDFAIARLLPDGALDTSFGNNGRRTVFFDLGGDKTDQAFAVALQADGKIIVAGRARGVNGTDPAVVRLLSNGNLDPSFGTGGKLTVDLSSSAFDGANALAVRSDGKILFAGQLHDKGFVARLLSSESIDPFFGNFGIEEVTASAAADYQTVEDLALQTDGKILLVATRFTGAERWVHRCRLLASGAVDPGSTCPGLGTSHSGRAIAPLSGGRSLIAGTAGLSDRMVFVTRYLNDGNFDFSFPGTNGWQFLSGVDSVAVDLKLTRDGKILVLGTAGLLGGEFALLRLNSNGTADPLFDCNPEPLGFGNPGDGRVIIKHYELLPTFCQASAARMALADRGRAILVGSVCLQCQCDTTGDKDFMIQRLNVRNDILVDSFE